MNQAANIQIFLSLMGAMALKTEQAPPGSVESAALDIMLSGSTACVMVLGGGALFACMSSRVKKASKAVHHLKGVVSKGKSDAAEGGKDADSSAPPNSVGVPIEGAAGLGRAGARGVRRGRE